MSRSKSVSMSKQWQSNGKSRSLSFGAFELHGTAMQIDATFHDEQAKARAGNVSDIRAAVKCLEQSRLVRHGNAAAAIADAKYSVVAVPGECKSDRFPFG